MAETESSVLAFGRRDQQRVVLKVIKQPGDEWRSGAVLQAFDGKGTVRIFDYVDGALLLERVSPGTSLVSATLNGGDDEATEVLADVIGRMSPREVTSVVPTVEDWSQGFDRYDASANRPLPGRLVDQARTVYVQLCRSQSRRRLLHGDLHHGNVLLDAERGWLAIDPKGVVGEPEYEIGAALRNPIERPAWFLSPATITARLDRFADRLHLNRERMVRWAFAQAVLSAVWAVEDGLRVDGRHPWLELARTLHGLSSAQPNDESLR
jgi:streptomycin 6-kinase